MEILKIVPFISFLAFVAILYFRVWQLQKKGIRLWSKQGKKKQSMYLLFPLFGLLLFVWLFEVIRAAFQFSTSILTKLLTYRLIESIFPEVFGTVLILLSLVLFWFTLNHFNTSLRFGLAKNNKGKLVTSGIFSMSRNPLLSFARNLLFRCCICSSLPLFACFCPGCFCWNSLLHIKRRTIYA